MKSNFFEVKKQNKKQKKKKNKKVVHQVHADDKDIKKRKKKIEKKKKENEYVKKRYGSKRGSSQIANSQQLFLHVTQKHSSFTLKTRTYHTSKVGSPYKSILKLQAVHRPQTGIQKIYTNNWKR